MEVEEGELTIVRRVRLVGIAIGSLVIAFLAVGLVAGIFLDPAGRASPLVVVLIVVLGGLIFVEIARGDRARSAVDGSRFP
jgi:hypothetical protein